jgi:hypothetical protein
MVMLLSRNVLLDQLWRLVAVSTSLGEVFPAQDDSLYPNAWFFHERQGWKQYVEHFDYHNTQQVVWNK